MSNSADDQSLEQHWTSIIEQARSHPHGVKRFCLENRIPPRTYYGWFKRLRDFHPEWHDKNFRGLREDRLSVVPPTEVKSGVTRRKFDAEYKLSILTETDLAPDSEAVGAILRREGLYKTQLLSWQEERRTGNLNARKRGPARNEWANEVSRLRAENARLNRELEQHKLVIELQKKVANILDSKDPGEKQ
jgi:transposase-like protein